MHAHRIQSLMVGLLTVVGYLDASGHIIEWPPSPDDPDLDTVSAWIGHFSPYIVAY